MVLRTGTILGVALLGAMACPAGAGEVPAVGEVAPPFALSDDGGAAVSLESMRGRAVLLAFYPKDFTGG